MATRPNQYPGVCEVCRKSVIAGESFITKTTFNDWRLTCKDCTNPTTTHTTAPPPPPNGSTPGAAQASKPPREVGPSRSDDLNLLIKLMRTTTIDNDNISLVAIRKANEWLSRHNLDWEQLLLGKVSVMADPFAEIAAPPAPKASPPPSRGYSEVVPPPVPPRPRPTPPPRPQRTSTPRPPFDSLNWSWDSAVKHDAAVRRAARAAAPPPRTFIPDAKSSIPKRKSAPSASDL